MQQPQPCTKCNNLPEDILMLACSHDLCLNCASERLSFQLKKRKPANSIVCQFCYERTPLDSQSISQLQKLIPGQKNASRSYIQPNKQPQTVNKYDRLYQKTSNKPQETAYRQRSTYQKPKERVSQYKPAPKQYAPVLSGSNSQMFQGISSKKSCNQHTEQDILYFCFTCKCQCICPQCVIHGKHKDHDVKTIKKSHPIIKNQLQASLDKIESNIENLLIRKSQVQKNIRSLNEQNSQSKRQIQQAFQQIRLKLDVQQRQMLTKCDSNLNLSIEELQKSTKNIIKRIDQLKSYSSATVQFIKKDELTLLNFYAKKWKDINDQCKDTAVNVPVINLPNNQKVLTAILDLTDQVDRLSTVSGTPSNDRRY